MKVGGLDKAMKVGHTVVTGHRDGAAVVASDRAVEAVPLAGPGVTANLLWEDDGCQVSYLTIAPGANDAHHGFIASVVLATNRRTS